MKKLFLSFVALLCAIVCNAQIGYQVSLLNTATGEPRSFETVKCEIEIKDSEGKAIHKESQKATSNDFGVISLSIGDEHTFDEMDWSKLPLFVSVSIDGKLVGESQILTVPVAEYAKKTGTLTYDNIGEKQVMKIQGPSYREYVFNFCSNHELVCRKKQDGTGDTFKGEYYIDGNSIYGFLIKSDEGTYYYPCWGHYLPEIDSIVMVIGEYRSTI